MASNRQPRLRAVSVASLPGEVASLLTRMRSVIETAETGGLKRRTLEDSEQNQRFATPHGSITFA
ncbi:MAG TPA: hypothetical protein DCP37_16345 [Dehalococcoidia bacterium]|nr:hypothetical protein [Dehalococcoidia bacterium]